MVESMMKEFGYFKLFDEMVAGMTFKNTGNFAVEDFGEKYRNIAKEVGLENAPPLITILANKHTNRVLPFIEKIEPPYEYICDGIIYKGSGAAVFFPGGCLPVAFRDMENNLSGLLHVSVQTISKDIISIFLKKWKSAGGNPSRTRVFFLPAICDDCLNYEVKYFQEKIFPEIKPAIDSTHLSQINFINYEKGFFYLNLIKLAKELIKKQDYDLISLSNECTCCNHNRYWCYRHHDNDRQKFRNAAFIITPEIEPLLPFQR